MKPNRVRSKTISSLLRRAAVVVGLAVLTAVPAGAQMSDGDASATTDTREQLRSRLERLEQVLANRPDSREAEDAQQRMEVLRRRLARGDFQAGDVVRLTVGTDSSLTGTFSVNTERELEFPTIPDLDLSGVLYAEAESAVRSHLEKFIRDPQVRVQVTRRIAVLGAVQSPGFYDLAPSTTLSDALMAAGGPMGNAKLDAVKLRRDGRNILEGRTPNLQQTTLADLGPSRNDELFVPQSGGGLGAIQILGIVSSISGAAWAITRIF